MVSGQECACAVKKVRGKKTFVAKAEHLKEGYKVQCYQKAFSFLETKTVHVH